MAGDITRRATIQFEADTSTAQARIQQLAQSLQQAVKFGMESSGVTVLDKQLQTATNDAIKLQAQLQSAVNVNTGKLDLTKFTQSLKTSNSSLQQYHTSLTQLGSAGQAAFANLARSIATAEAPMQRVSNVLAQMGTTLKNTIKWNISASIINGFVGGIQSAFNYAERLNESLNRIQIVTGESTAQMAKFAEQANKSAQALSTTTRAYTDAALIFYQQGLGDADVRARTDAVIKMANVTGDAAKEVSNYMTAIWNNFDNGTASLESFEDKIVSLGATTASSSAEIAAGLEKFAAIGNTIGLSFDYAAAALSTVVAETRQSADTVGTAFRTLFSRLQGLKLGETLDDGTNLNKYSAALASVGVQIKNASGQLKDMDTILSELAENWNNLDRAQQTALAQTVGGARQYTTLIALMENWDQFQKNLRTEANSEGELGKQAEIYAQSWEAAKNRVTAATEEIYSTLINDQFFIGFNNSLAQVLDGINAIIKGMGGVPGLISRIGSVALTVFEGQIAASLRNLMTNLELLTTKGQEKMRAIQTETVSMMGSLGGEGTGGKITGSAYGQEAQAQALILQNMSKMDEIEKSRAQMIQKVIQARTDENVKLGETITQLEDLYNKQSSGAEKTTAELDKLKATLDSITFDNGETGTSVFERIKLEMEAVNDAAKDRTAFTKYFEAFNQADTAKGRIEALKAALQDTSIQGGQKAAASMQYFEYVLKKVENGTYSTEKGIELLQKRLETGVSQATQDGAEHLNQFNANIDTLIARSQELGTTQITGWLNALKAQFNGSAATMEQMAEALAKVSNNTLTTENALRLLKQLMGEVQTKTLDTSQKIVKFGQVLSTIGTAITQITGLIDIWKNKDMSLGKKLLTTITTIGMLLPMLIRLKTNIYEIGVSNLTAAAGTSTHAAALVAEATAAAGATGPTYAFGTALWYALGPIGAIVIGLTGLIAIVTLLAKKFGETTKEFTLADALSEVTARAEAAKTKLTELNDLIEQMKDKGSEYDELRSALDNCTEGTSEWYEALQKVQDKGNEILASFPLLSRIIKDPFKYFGENFDITSLYDETTGGLDIGKLLARALEVEQQYQAMTSLDADANDFYSTRIQAENSYRTGLVTRSYGTNGDIDLNTADEYSGMRGIRNGGFGNLNFEDIQAGFYGTNTIWDTLISNRTMGNMWTYSREAIDKREDRDLIWTELQNAIEQHPDWLSSLMTNNVQEMGDEDLGKLAYWLNQEQGVATATAMDALAKRITNNDEGGNARYKSYSGEITGGEAWLTDLFYDMMQFGVENSIEGVDFASIAQEYFKRPENAAMAGMLAYTMSGGDSSYLALANKPIDWNALDQYERTNTDTPFWDMDAYQRSKADYSAWQNTNAYDFTSFNGTSTMLIGRRSGYAPGEEGYLTTKEAAFARSAVPHLFASDQNVLLAEYQQAADQGEAYFSTSEYQEKLGAWLDWIDGIEGLSEEGFNVSPENVEIEGGQIVLTKNAGSDSEETKTFSATAPITYDAAEAVGNELIDIAVEKYRSWDTSIQDIATQGGYKRLTMEEYQAIQNDFDYEETVGDQILMRQGRRSQFQDLAEIMGWTDEELGATFDTMKYAGYVESTGTWLTNLTEAQNKQIDALDADLATRVRNVLKDVENVNQYFTEEGILDTSAFGGNAELDGLRSELENRGQGQKLIDFNSEWENINAALKKVHDGKKLTDEEVDSVRSYIAGASEYFELTADGWQFIGENMSVLTAEPLQKLTTAREQLEQIANMQDSSQIDISDWNTYGELLEILGYSQQAINYYVEEAANGNEEAVAKLSSIKDEVLDLADNVDAMEFDDQFVYQALSYCKTTSEIATILSSVNKTWGDLPEAVQKEILTQLGMAEKEQKSLLGSEIQWNEVTAAFSSQETRTALDKFISSYSSYITDDMKEQLDTQPDDVLNASTKFVELKQQIADMLGVSVDLITNDWLKTNWEHLQNLGSGDLETVQTSLDTLVRSFDNVQPKIVKAGLADASAYLTGNLLSKTQKQAQHTISQGVDELNQLLTTLVDDVWLGKINDLTEQQMQAEIDANSEFGKKITAVRQMIADLLGVDIDKISLELVKQWSANGTLKNLATGGQSGSTLELMAQDLRSKGTQISNTGAVVSLLDILGPQSSTATATIGEGIATLETLSTSLRSGNLKTLLSGGQLQFNEAGAISNEGYFTPADIKALSELKTALAALLQVDVSNITDQQISDWYSAGYISGTISGDRASAIAGYNSMYSGVHGPMAFNANAGMIGTSLATYIKPEQLEKYTSANTQAVIDAFASRDFSQITKGRLEHAIADFATLDANKIIKEGNSYLEGANLIEQVYDETTKEWSYQLTSAAQEMGYQSMQELIEGLQTGTQNAFDSLDLSTISTSLGEKLGPAVQKVLTQMDQDKILTSEAVQNVSSVLQTADIKGGAAGFRTMTELLQAAGDNAGWVAGQLTNWDGTLETLTPILQMAGISTDDLGFELQYLCDAMSSAITFTSQLSQALNNYSGDKGIADKLRNGTSLTDAEYQRYIQMFGIDQARQDLKQNADSTWSVADNIDGKVLAAKVEEAIANGFSNAVTQAQDMQDLWSVDVPQRTSAYDLWSTNNTAAYDDLWGLLGSNLSTLFTGLNETDLQKATAALGHLQQDNITWEDFYNNLTELAGILGVDIPTLLSTMQDMTAAELERATEASTNATTAVSSLEKAQTGLDALTSSVNTTKDAEKAASIASRYADSSQRSGMTSAQKATATGLYSTLGDILGTEVNADNFTEQYKQMYLDLMSGDEDTIRTAFADINQIRTDAGLEAFPEETVEAWVTTLCSQYREAAETELQNAITSSIEENFSGKNRADIQAIRDTYDKSTRETRTSAYISQGYLEDLGDGILSATDKGKKILGDNFEGDLVEGLDTAVGTGLENAEQAFAAENIFANYADKLADGSENQAKQLAMSLWTTMADVAGSEIANTDASKFISIAEKAVAAGVTDLSTLTDWLSTSVPVTLMDEVLGVLTGIDWSNIDANAIMGQLAAAGIDVNADSFSGVRDWIISMIQAQASEYVKAATNDFASDGGFESQSSRQLKQTREDLGWKADMAEDEYAAYQENIKAALQKQGLLDENGNITKAGEDLGYSSADELIAGFEAGLDKAITDLDIDNLAERLAPAMQAPFKAIMTSIQDSAGEITWKDNDNVKSLLRNAQSWGGEAGMNQMSELFNQMVGSGVDASKAMSALSGLDFSNLNFETVKASLQEQGVYSADLDAAIIALCDSMAQAITYTNELTNALNSYAGTMGIIDKLKADQNSENVNPQSYTQAEYDQIAAQYGQAYADQMFKGRADGSYVLTDRGSAGMYETQVRTGMWQDYAQAAAQAQGLVQFASQDWGSGYTGMDNFLAANTSSRAGILDLIAANANQGNFADINLGRASELSGLFTTANDMTVTAEARQAAMQDAMSILGVSSVEDMMAAALPLVQANANHATEVATDVIGRSGMDAGELHQAYQQGQYLGTDEEYMSQLHDARSMENKEIYGMSDSEIANWEKFADAVKDGTLALKNMNGEAIDTGKLTDDVIDELTRSISRYDKALVSVQKNTKTWNDVMKKGTADEQAVAIQEMKQAYSDMLDIDMSSLSDDFAANADNLKLMEEAANGSEEAYNQLAQAATKDIVAQANLMGGDEFINGINEIKNGLNQPWDDIEVGASLDDTDFLNALTEMVNAAGLTAQQAEDALMGMGIDAEVVEDTGETTDTKEDVGFHETVTATQIPGEVTVPQDGGGAPTSYPTTMVQYTKTITPDVQSEDETKTTTATGIKVIGAHKAAGGGVKHTNASHGGGSRGGRGGGGCFEAGTLITTINGYKKIEDIQVGDIVLSYNEKLQKNEYSQVLETMIHVVVDDIYTLHIKDDNLVVTGIHRFFVKRMGRTMWIPAANLHINDVVLFADGTWHLIENIDIEFKAAVVYNFEVSGNHNYYVGKNRILAHNKGGGGGRRQDHTGDRKRKEQRYVTNTNQLEDIQDKLDKINKAEGRSYGRNRLKQMKDKAKALQELAAKQKDLYDEAVKYAAQDKKDLQENELAKKMGIKFEFDENGTILNRDEIEQKMVDFYNTYTEGKDEKGNWILKDNTEEGAKAFKEMQEQYKDLEDLLSKYDESQDKVKEYWQAHLDAINEAYDTIVEMANYKVEVQVQVSDEALKLIDFMLGTIEDDAYKAADAIALMGKKALEYVNQDKINEAGIRDLFNHHDGQSQYADDEGNLHTTTDLRGIVDGLLNGDQSAWDELMTHEEEFTQDELDSIQKMIDAKLDATQQLLATQKEVYAQIGAVFDKGNEDMDRMINKIDHLSSITQHYNNIVDLVGHKKLGLTNDMLNEMDQSAVNQKLSKLRAVNSKYKTQQAEMSTLDSTFHDGKNWGTEQQREAALKKSGESLDKKSELEKQSIAKKEEREIAKDAKALTKDRISDIKESIKDQKEIEKAATAAEKEAEGLAKNTQAELTKQQQAFEKLRVNRKGGGGRGTSEDLVTSAQSFSEEVSASLDKMSASTKKGKKGQSLQKIGDVTNGLVAQAETAKLMKETASIEKAGAQAKLKALDSELIKEQDLLEIQSTKLDGLDKEIQALDKEAATQGELAETYRKLGEEGTELTERDKELLEEQTEHMEDVIEETQEQLYSSWEEAIQAICDLYTTMIGRAIEDAGDKLAGELGSLDELADRFAKAQEIDNLYVADYERIYELSKLNRDILKSIDETDNVKAKQALADLQAEINQMDEDNVKLSEYQIENARRRYELTLAQLQLEEAKGAKSNVQMSRSATGEWSYVYTADETAVEEAEQNYEDKLYAMQKANAEYINELQQNIVDLQQRMMEEIQALRVEDFASAEEYYQAVQAIKDHYSQLMDYNVEQLGIVFDEQERLYTDDWATYSQMTGYKISADEDYVDSWQETALAQQTGFDTMEQFHQNFNDTTDELFEDCLDAYETWEDNVEQAMEAVGTSTDEFGTKMEEDIGKMTEEAERLAESVQQMGEDIQEAFLEMTEALSNWQAEYSAVIEDMLKKNEALAQSFNNLLKEWSGYNETVGQDPETPGEGEEEEPGPEPEGPPADEGEPEQPEEEDKTEKLKKGVAFAIWSYPGGAGWGHGNSSRRLTSGERFNKFKEKGLIPDDVQQQINRYRGKSFDYMKRDTGIDAGGWKSDKHYKNLGKYTYRKWAFDTGGYTGEWGDGDGRLAVLHSKEIVLNKDDTTNFLAGIEILRDIVRLIDLNAVASAGYLSNAGTVGAMASTGDTLEQEVHITAEFPNATDKDEIKAAFEDLINLASQYANRK